MAYFEKKYHTPGTAPGTLSDEREAGEPDLRLTLFDYTGDELAMRENIGTSDCTPYLQKPSTTWVHVQGRATSAQLRELGAAFQLHPLAVEDVHNTGQRPKAESFDQQIFVVMALPLMERDEVEVQQVSIVVSGTSVVSFCEGPFEIFQPIMKRLQDKGSRLRHRGADYLLYTILDVVIDQGFPVLEEFSAQLEDLEERVLDSPGDETLSRIHTMRRELILLRRMLWPQREVISQLLREEDLFAEDTVPYLRDCYDHTIQVMDLLETYRDMATSMLEIYLSSVSNRMNEVMRLLTVIATIFIPLTFIAGVYGMNFDRQAGGLNMPELGWPFGYLLVWGVMVAVALAMVVYFRRKGWF